MKTLLTITLVVVSTVLYAQNDRRGFQGKVTAQQTAVVDAESGDQLSKSASKTVITFSGRNITIGGEAYDIVTREFDGKKTNTFKCTKRRATFSIIYIPGESITVIDVDNDEERTVYSGLSEG